MKLRGEASLRGHLKNNEKDKSGKAVKEKSGSSAYVPKEPEKDTQLQYALSFLRGTATDAKTAGNSIDPQLKAPGAGAKDKAKN